MKRIRYLTLMLIVLLGGTTVWAQTGSGFDPTSPTEPGGPITAKVPLTVAASPVSGGSVSGGGKYLPGSSATLRATAAAGYVFVNWTKQNGDVVSTSSQFSYTTGSEKETLTANFVFNPNGPGEPGDINQGVKHWLRIEAEEGASSVSNSARYLMGTNVTVNASAQADYAFVGWYDENGLQLTTNRSYTLTMPAAEVKLKAKFDYTPAAPAEPGEIKAKHKLALTAQTGGAVSAGSYRLLECESTTVRATPSSGFVFEGWYHNGVLYTESTQFTYTMGASDDAFEARFTFSPNSPSEPTQIKEKDYAFYLMNVIGKPGDVVKFPLHLTTRAEARSMTFQLSFPDNLLPDFESMTVAEDAAAYTVTHQVAQSDTEGRTTYLFELTLGDDSEPLAIGDRALLTFNIAIPADIETAKGYPVSINQVSVADADGNTQNAGARNGRVSVYKNGDSNGDDAVDIMDVMNLIDHICKDETEVFIEEVSDVDGDESVDVNDIMGIIDIMTE